MGDTEVEGDETFTLKWVTPWTNVLLVRYTHTGTIRDDDGASVPVIPAALSIADAGAEEGDSLMSFTVTLDKAVAGGLKVTPTFTDGTATKRRRLHPQHRRPQLQRHRRRDPELQHIDHRRHGRGRR